MFIFYTMGFMPNKSLAALIWASAVLATPCKSSCKHWRDLRLIKPPVIGGSIPTHDLGIGQERTTLMYDKDLSTHGLDIRQERCRTEYTTQNGLRFTGYCDSGIWGYGRLRQLKRLQTLSLTRVKMCSTMVNLPDKFNLWRTVWRGAPGLMETSKEVALPSCMQQRMETAG